MSRAFVKDTDDGFEDLPDRPISEHPNDVTKEGLQQIEAAVTAAQAAHAAAQASGERAAMATPSREYRAGIERAIAKGWLWRHESGTYVKFTDAGAELLIAWIRKRGNLYGGMIRPHGC